MRILIIMASLFTTGCSVNYGTRHAVEDYDVIRFEYSTLYMDAGIDVPTEVRVCERVSAWVGGEHDIAGDPYKVVSASVGCSFNILQ